MSTTNNELRAIIADESLQILLSSDNPDVRRRAINRTVRKIEAHAQQRVRLAETNVWKKLKKADGFYRNENGCIEIHPDYIDEQIAAIEKLQQSTKGS